MAWPRLMTSKEKSICLAIEDAAKGFKNISRSVKKTDGEKAARQLIGGSIFADRAYQRTKAEILGNNLKSTLSNSYATTQVDGRSLNTFSLQSPCMYHVHQVLCD